MLRAQFEVELGKLHNQFYAMGTAVLGKIHNTVRAFTTHDRELAKEVIEADKKINEFEVKLEKKSLEIIALQQPVSTDLRRVITVLKATSDLERMGDHAVSIAKAAICMKGEVRIPIVEEEIKNMGKEARRLVESSLDLYLNSGDIETAYEIAASDEIINEYYSKIQELTTEEIKKNPDSLIAGRDYFQVLTYLERIGDYAKNICEWVVYLHTGDITEL